MLEEAGRLRAHVPVARIGEDAPGIDMAPDLVDDGRRIVLLFGRRKALALVEDEASLIRRALPPPRLGDRSDELGPPSGFYDLLSRLTFRVELPVTAGIFIGRIKDGALEERVRHCYLLFA